MTRPKKQSAFADLELEAGTTAHYVDAAYYTKTYLRRTEDVAYYEALADSVKGEVLEYGCGNGRIAIPMARRGARVTGVDLSASMLADFETRRREEPADVRARLRSKRGDMRTLKLGKRFELVTCPFNAFLHLYEHADVSSFLERVKEHLAPGGRFVFDVSIPDASELARKPEKLYRTRPFLYPGIGFVRYGERFDYDPLRQILFVTMEFEPMDGSEPFMTPLAHRQFYPKELEALLGAAGFEIEAMLGDFEGPPHAESRMLVLECGLKRAGRRSPPRRRGTSSGG